MWHWEDFAIKCNPIFGVKIFLLIFFNLSLHMIKFLCPLSRCLPLKARDLESSGPRPLPSFRPLLERPLLSGTGPLLLIICKKKMHLKESGLLPVRKIILHISTMDLNCLLHHIMTFFGLFPFVTSPAGKCAVRGRSAVRCTGWKTATCGAPPAAGRKPVRDSPTDPSRPMQRLSSRRRSCRPEKCGARGLHFACTWSFCSPESQLSVKLRPLFHVSESLPAAEANEGWQSGFSFFLFFPFVFSRFCPGFLILPPPFPSFPVKGKPQCS